MSTTNLFSNWYMSFVLNQQQVISYQESRMASTLFSPRLKEYSQIEIKSMKKTFYESCRTNKIGDASLITYQQNITYKFIKSINKALETNSIILIRVRQSYIQKP